MMCRKKNCGGGAGDRTRVFAADIAVLVNRIGAARLFFVLECAEGKFYIRNYEGLCPFDTKGECGLWPFRPSECRSWIAAAREALAQGGLVAGAQEEDGAQESGHSKGMVLFVVLMISLLMSLLVIALYTLALTAHIKAKRSHERIQCMAYAEGGLDFAAAIVREYAKGRPGPPAETFTGLLKNQSRLHSWRPDPELKLAIDVFDNFDDADPLEDRDCRIVIRALAIYPISSKAPARTELWLRTYPGPEDENCLEDFYFSNWEQRRRPRQLTSSLILWPGAGADSLCERSPGRG